jgi:hypothetical protein
MLKFQTSSQILGLRHQRPSLIRAWDMYYIVPSELLTDAELGIRAGGVIYNFQGEYSDEASEGLVVRSRREWQTWKV